MKSVYCTKPSYTRITCSKISNIPYSLIFTAKYNELSILITIISCDYLNLSLVNEYAGDAKISTNVIKYNQCSSRRINHSNCSIHVKLSYLKINKDVFTAKNLILYQSSVGDMVIWLSLA